MELIRLAKKSAKVLSKTSRGFLITNCISAFFHGLSWALEIYCTARFFDTAAWLIQGKVSGWRFGVELLFLVTSFFFCQFMNGADNCRGMLVDAGSKKETNSLRFSHISQLPWIDFENTERLDVMNKAKEGVDELSWSILTPLDVVFFYGTYFLFIACYLFTVKPIIGLGMFLIFVPCLVNRLLQQKQFEDLEDIIAPLRRKCEYYEKCITDLKETRVLGWNHYYQEKWAQTRKELNRYIAKVHIKKELRNFAMDSITVLCYGCILALLVVSVMNNEVTIGIFAAVITSLTRIYSFMDEVISERIAITVECNASVNNYYEFIEEPEISRKIEMPEKEQNYIELSDCSFSYPGRNEKALKDITISIKKGETVAIVGRNGSGKSTLCKMLLGMVEPESGKMRTQVKMDYSNASAVFQNYQRYKMSIEDNIRISEWQKGNPALTLYKQMDVNIDAFPEQEKTMLGREFDGEELSGGNWQRLAIARGLYRENEFIVLDEPTAAIDPKEEQRIYRQFAETCRNKTALIVTHRLGAVQMADRIIVMKDGNISQIGTHQELIGQEGEYRTLYDSQKQWYV